MPLLAFASMAARYTETEVPCNYMDLHPGHDPFDDDPSSPNYYDRCIYPTKTDRFGRCAHHPLTKGERRNLDTTAAPWKYLNPPLPQCEAPGCTRMMTTNGRCYAHDMRRRIGSPDQDAPIGSLSGPRPRCSDTDCDDQARADDLCWEHAYKALLLLLPPSDRLNKP